MRSIISYKCIDKGCLLLTKISFIAIALFAFSLPATEQLSSEKLASTLIEAEDYLSVKPSRSLALLSTDANLSLLSKAQFFRWHIALIRASLSFNDLSTMESSIKKLMQHKSSTEFEYRLVSMLSSIGIWLRKSGYLEQAKLVLTCALTNNKSKESEIKLLISLAIVSRQLSQNDYAKKVYHFAKSILPDNNLTSSAATIENNLGVLALEDNDVVKAEQYFRAALVMYQEKSIRSGNIISGINLLQTFLIQYQHVNYQRLYPSIVRLTNNFPNESKKSILFWLNTVFNVRQGAKLNDELKIQLKANFSQINDHKLQLSIKKYFADELKIEITPSSPLPHKESPPLWLDEMSHCDWQKLKAFKLESLK